MKKLFIYDSQPRKVGKSRSIKAIFHEMKHRRDMGKIAFRYDILEGSDEFSNEDDLKVLIYYRDVTIGLESRGDPNSRLVNSIDEFVNQYGCDIIICACRTKGRDVSIAKAMCRQAGYTFMPAPHFVVRKQDKQFYYCLAEHYADSVIAAIDKWIDLYK